MNNALKILAAATFAIAAIGGAHAESYNGVHPLVSANSRADVHAQAVVAAHSANPYATGYGQGVTTVASSVDRATVRSQAYAAARTANPYAEGYGQGVAQLANGNVDRAAIRAEARAAARGDDLAL